MGNEWRSYTYGQLNIEEIPKKLLEFYKRNLDSGEPMEITIGTDSQNRTGYTKIVSVISIICRGRGGIFFHQVEYSEMIFNVREKLERETNRSLEIAHTLIDLLEQEIFQEIFLNCPISIHIDAGNAPNGKTKDLVQSLIGWVHAMGYDCEVKPNSYAASSIADRISK